MKKNIFIAALAATVLCFTSCQKDDEIVSGNNTVTPAADLPVDNARVKSTSDLHNTDWTSAMTYSEFLTAMTGADLSCIPGFEDDTMTVGLNFDGTYAHFSFSDNIAVYAGEEGELDRIAAIAYTYYYDGTTHTGYFEGVTEDTDGNEIPSHLQFTYDTATDAITFALPMVDAEAGTPVTLTLVFLRNE